MNEHRDEFKEFKDLVKIIDKNYYRHNAQFTHEFINSLRGKTGNDNIGIFCMYIIDNILSHKKS